MELLRSLQESLSHGFQKSIPGSTDTYLVPSANNYIIGLSVKKCIHRSMEVLFNSAEPLLVTCGSLTITCPLMGVHGSSYWTQKFHSISLASQTHAVVLCHGISLQENAQAYDQEIYLTLRIQTLSLKAIQITRYSGKGRTLPAHLLHWSY